MVLSATLVKKKGENEIFQIFVLKDTIKNRLAFQLKNINRNLPKINNSKIHDFSLT